MGKISNIRKFAGIMLVIWSVFVVNSILLGLPLALFLAIIMGMGLCLLTYNVHA